MARTGGKGKNITSVLSCKVCKLKNLGLVIFPFKAKNQSFLSKWLWRIGDGGLWKDVSVDKYSSRKKVEIEERVACYDA